MSTQADLTKTVTAAVQAAQPVAVYFVQIVKTIWEFNVLAGTRHGIPTPKELADRKMILDKAGVRHADWPGGAVDDPGAFGVPI